LLFFFFVVVFFNFLFHFAWEFEPMAIETCFKI